jgi:hypothetical protein
MTICKKLSDTKKLVIFEDGSAVTLETVTTTIAKATSYDKDTLSDLEDDYLGSSDVVAVDESKAILDDSITLQSQLTSLVARLDEAQLGTVNP